MSKISSNPLVVVLVTFLNPEGSYKHLFKSCMSVTNVLSEATLEVYTDSRRLTAILCGPHAA